MRSVLIFATIFAVFEDRQCLQRALNPRLNFFDIDLLRHTAESKPGNVVLSPASIKATLAMLLEGAEGRTAAEIQSTLRLSPSKQEFREEIKMFVNALETNITGSLLHSSNGLFVSNNLKLKKDYEATLKRVYSTEIRSLNFTDTSKATQLINDWVDTETKGLIPVIVDEVHVSPATEAIVANALYFKGSWLHQFHPKLTHGGCFYRDNNCKVVAMMELEAELNYAYMSDLRSHALELPYQGNRYTLILLVPEDRDAGVALIRDLPHVGLPEISNQMEPTQVILTMPKFSIDYSEDLVTTMKSMGIISLFTTRANLTGIFEETSHSLTNLHQSIHLTVDEGGTTAAAATAGFLVPLIGNIVQLLVNRPFLFFIRDNELGLMLFEGKIEEPTLFEEDDDEVPLSPAPENVTPTVSKVPPKPEEGDVDHKNKAPVVPDSSNDGSKGDRATSKPGTVEPPVKVTRKPLIDASIEPPLKDTPRPEADNIEEHVEKDHKTETLQAPTTQAPKKGFFESIFSFYG